MLAITLLSHINIRFIIFSGSYHSPFLSVFSSDKKPRNPHEQRRKRAIILFARTTFAWFTSQDEVTNRLSASADYNVSIIENFVPPKQWVPGQTVTKEEAVVNTGNIDAFVKQQITGDLTVTVEVPTAVAPTAENAESDKYIELNSAEVGSLEAGSYLAWSPKSSEIGSKIVYAMDVTNEHNTSNETNFKPSTTGLYIFRRAITTDDNMKDTAYEYVGYYYVAAGEDGKSGKFYKLNDIDENTLSLATSGNGNLAAAPSVKYATEKTDTIKKVAMTYDADNDQLKVSYSTETNPNLSNLAALDRTTYNAYRAYMDAQTGKTKWDISRYTDGTQDNKGTAADTTNVTGLTDYDEFNHTEEAQVKSDLSNWSLDRLTARAEETKATLDAASPASEFTDANWKEVYDAAVKERKIVNKGVRSATRLSTLKTTVTSLIGTGGNGLVQSTDYPFYYSASATSATPTTGNFAVVLQNPTTIKSSDIPASATVPYLTVDNMDEPRFQDMVFKADGTTVTYNRTSSTFGTGANTDVQWNTPQVPYAEGTFSDLVNAWTDYVNHTKRLILIQAKIDLLTDYTTTDVGRNDTEMQTYLTLLQSQKNSIESDLAAAKTAYETQISTLNGYLTQLNEYQDDINRANEVSSNTVDDTDYYGGDGTTSGNYPDEKSTVWSGGQKLTGAEQTLYDYLIAVYGVAYKDSGFDVDYVGVEDSSPLAAADEYEDIWTYSPTVTRNTVDANLGTPNNDGKIAFVTPASGSGYGTIGESTSPFKQSDVIGKPYYENKKVNYMKDYRDDQINHESTGLLALYNAALAASNLSTTAAETVGPIDIIVQLANQSDDGTVAKSWQYIADATGTNEYNFYYTSILPSGATSSLLIDSVTMGSNVTQDMFRDLQFDLNVTSESAQVVYDGDIARPTSANETITGAKTTGDTYYANSVVTWEKDKSAKNAINDEDPNPKAEVPAVPVTKYKFGAIYVDETDFATLDETIATTGVESGANVVYAYKITVNGKTYAGKDKNDGTVYYEYTPGDGESAGTVDKDSSLTLTVTTE